MSRDEVAVLVLVGTLAAWGTLHVLTSVRLARLGPWWRGPVALLVPPLAPFWAYRSGLRVRAIAWVLLVVAWLVARPFLAR